MRSIIRVVNIMLLAAALLITAVSASQAQPTSSVTVEPATLTVGDPVRVTLNVKHPNTQRAQVGEMAWEPVEVRETEPAVNTASGTQFAWIVTLWRPGVYELPSISVEILQDGAVVETAVSSPTTLTVTSVLTADDQALRDIRAQATLPAPSRWWMWLLLGGGGLVAAWQLSQRRPTRLVPADAPAPQTALAALNELEAAQAAHAQPLATFATAVFQLLRQFIQLTYRLPAHVQTTQELTDALTLAEQITPPPSPLRQRRLHAILSELDAVRFSPPSPAAPEAKTLTHPVRELLEQMDREGG